MFNYDCITRQRPYSEEKKEKLSENSITGNKITQDQENISKEVKVVSSIEGTKIPSILTSPPYKNKKYYKGVTNDKTCDSHTRKTSDSLKNNDRCARNLD